ncbi:MAG TPA: MaoC/PaaZ C-terminal domain-containing protein [Victivallales bacterium]|nr:MaoC/PaaZ C-terminal domain-containing protein [Victivallales bacterium]
MKYYYEDLNIGDKFYSDYYTVSKKEILTFAEQYDQLPIHTKENDENPFADTVIASGWNLCALTMRLMIEALLGNSSALISPGIEKIEWKKPVFPNDKVKIKMTIGEKRLSMKKKGLGIIKFHVEMYNQNEEIVLSMIPTGFFGCK